MAYEHWSPAAELTQFMEETQELGNKLAGNIAVGRKFHGEDWATAQLQQMAACSEANRDALAEVIEHLNTLNLVPHVHYEGALGRWIGVSVTPDNCYSLHTKLGTAQLQLKLGKAVLVDAQPLSLANPIVSPAANRPAPPRYLQLGSSLFAQPSPRGTII